MNKPDLIPHLPGCPDQGKTPGTTCFRCESERNDCGYDDDDIADAIWRSMPKGVVIALALTVIAFWSGLFSWLF